jgi:hypothetical protein
LELSLAETPKNENLLIAACHFWSNGINTFLFGHGPMSPTLADVYMITGLDISGPMDPFQYKGSTRQKGVKTGSGYKSYIQNHMKDGPLGEVEYRAFLNMWLCRFIFCGKANEPTLNHIAMATDLATGHRTPLGKYLLGSVYHMLHQTISQMHTGQKISCVNGPWWFVHGIRLGTTLGLATMATDTDVDYYIQPRGFQGGAPGDIDEIEVILEHLDGHGDAIAELTHPQSVLNRLSIRLY